MTKIDDTPLSETQPTHHRYDESIILENGVILGIGGAEERRKEVGLGRRNGGIGDKRVVMFGIFSILLYESLVLIMCFSNETHELLVYLMLTPLTPILIFLILYMLENRKDAYLSTIFESFYIGIGATLWLLAIDATWIFIDVLFLVTLFLNEIENNAVQAWILSYSIYLLILPTMMILTISFCCYIRLTGKSIINRYSALLFAVSVTLGISFIYSLLAMLYMHYSFTHPSSSSSSSSLSSNSTSKYYINSTFNNNEDNDTILNNYNNNNIGDEEGENIIQEWQYLGIGFVEYAILDPIIKIGCGAWVGSHFSAFRFRKNDDDNNNDDGHQNDDNSLKSKLSNAKIVVIPVLYLGLYEVSFRSVLCLLNGNDVTYFSALPLPNQSAHQEFIVHFIFGLFFASLSIIYIFLQKIRLIAQLNDYLLSNHHHHDDGDDASLDILHPISLNSDDSYFGADHHINLSLFRSVDHDDDDDDDDENNDSNRQNNNDGEQIIIQHSA